METTKKTKKLSSLVSVDPRLLKVSNSLNIREDYGDINELTHSIADHGVLSPLSGYIEVLDGVEFYCIVDGHRRLKAIMKCIENGVPIARVPFIVEDYQHSVEERVCNMLLFNDGKPYNQYEQAKVYHKLINLFGYTTTEVAKKVNKQVSYISNTMSLLTLPIQVQNAIGHGEISPNTAMSIMRSCANETDGVKAVMAAIEEAKHNGKTKATNAHAKIVLGDKPTKSKEALIKNILDIVSHDQNIDKRMKKYKIFHDILMSIQDELNQGKTMIEAIELSLK